MGIEHVKWWQWFLLSIVLGTLLALINLNMPEESGALVGQTKFEESLTIPPIGNEKHPAVFNITVYPTQETAVPGERACVVTYKALEQERDNADVFKVVKYTFIAKSPYWPTQHYRNTYYDDTGKLPPGIAREYIVQKNDTLPTVIATVYGKYSMPGEDAIKTANEWMFRRGTGLIPGETLRIPWNPVLNKTVADYLAEVKARFPYVSYRTAWWRVPKTTWSLFGGSTVLIVGVIWPVLLQLLIKGGFGRDIEEGVDLSKYGRGRKEEAKPVNPNAITADDLAQMKALEEKLMASLAQKSDEEREEDELEKAAAATLQIKQLKAGPMESATSGDAEQQPHEYRGEFYPVEKNLAKKPPDPK